ncbi:MAG: hypothetical protein N5P05_000286 [Chroococcopsis gigantea SAG 12.99]|jgi:hypothetical protein|nr:hypothetical protein [Chroococcopsis gigantea SAG 12.99]
MPLINRPPTIKLYCTSLVMAIISFILQDALPASAAPCQPGTFSNDGQAPCQNAPLGFYVPNAGATVATAASPGFFVPTTGASAATAAPLGSFVSTAGASTATLASPGFFVPTTGASAATAAPLGSFVSTAGASTATLATPGFFVPTTGASAATAAPLGSFVSTSGASFATLSPAGFYVPTIGSIAAIVCPNDSTSIIGSPACRQGLINAPSTVSPIFNSNYGTGGLYTLAYDPNVTNTYVFNIFNASSDLGYSSPLTDLSLLNLTLSGTGSNFYNTSNFVSGTVLGEGENFSFQFTIDPSLPNNSLVTFDFSTDQFAAFGTPGQTFSFSFQTNNVSVPEPRNAIAILGATFVVTCGGRLKRELSNRFSKK